MLGQKALYAVEWKDQNLMLLLNNLFFERSSENFCSILVVDNSAALFLIIKLNGKD